MIRTQLFTRSAIGLALALGVVTGGAFVSTPALAAKKESAPKAQMSKPFIAAAGPLQKALEAAPKRADVIAAKQVLDAANAAFNQSRGAARAEAKAKREEAVAALGATLTNEKQLLEAAFAAVSNDDDKFVAGQFCLNLGILAGDQTLQQRGLRTELESGKVPAADVGRFNYYVGSIGFDQKDWKTAQTFLGNAVAAGFHDSDADALLADAYIQDDQIDAGLAKLHEAIAYAKGAGKEAPDNWFRRGIGVAYKAKKMDQVQDFSFGLVENYPTTENWGGAITILRELGRFQAQETLDLMRLMDRTKSYAEERDYIEYIQAADPRRLPGEVLKVIGLGVAAGKLNTSDVFVSDAKNNATGRVAGDKISIAGLAKDARAANATAATAMAAGDAFLSYEDPAQAEEFYTIALTKPGVDAPRVLTRLGIAQADLGKTAEAQATFAKVEGVRAPIAKLWSIYVGTKAAPAN